MAASLNGSFQMSEMRRRSFLLSGLVFLPLSRSCHNSSEEGEEEEEEVKGANEIRTKRLSGKSSYFAALFCFPVSSSFLLLGREAYFAGTLDTWT